jgi:hypothetical protein
MNFSTEYKVDAAMQDASLRQSLYVIHIKAKLPAFALLFIFGIVVVIVGPDLNPFIRWLIPGVFVLLILMWLRAYRELIKIGRARLAMSSDPKSILSFDSSAIELKNANETKRYEWSKLERFVETKDFLLLMVGRLSLFCIPKEFLSTEAESYIKEKMKNEPNK